MKTEDSELMRLAIETVHNTARILTQCELATSDEGHKTKYALSEQYLRAALEVMSEAPWGKE